MRRVAPVSLVLLTALAGCSSTDTREKATAGAPAGVVNQYETLAQEVSEGGEQAVSGDWTVSYVVGAAEPWFEGRLTHGQTFRKPKSDETHHIEIIPTESRTGRIKPDVPISLRSTLGAPTFKRHRDSKQEAPLAEGATVEFPNVELTTP